MQWHETHGCCDDHMQKLKENKAKFACNQKEKLFWFYKNTVIGMAHFMNIIGNIFHPKC